MLPRRRLRRGGRGAAAGRRARGGDTACGAPAAHADARALPRRLRRAGRGLVAAAVERQGGGHAVVALEIPRGAGWGGAAEGDADGLPRDKALAHFIETRNEKGLIDRRRLFGALFADLQLLSRADAFVGTAASWTSRLVLLAIAGEIAPSRRLRWSTSRSASCGLLRYLGKLTLEWRQHCGLAADSPGASERMARSAARQRSAGSLVGPRAAA